MSDDETRKNHSYFNSSNTLPGVVDADGYKIVIFRLALLKATRGVTCFLGFMNIKTKNMQYFLFFIITYFFIISA